MGNRDFSGIAERVRNIAERFPERAAILHRDKRIAYAEFWKRAVRGAEFVRKNMRGNWPVAVCMGRWPDLYVAILSVILAWRAYAPIDPSFPEVRRRSVIEGLGFPPVIVDRPLLDGAFEGCETFFDLPKSGEPTTSEAGFSSQGNRPIYVIHTSGSTGVPKGVQMSENALLNLLDWQSSVSASTCDSHVTLQFSPIGFDVSFQETFSTLCDGWTLVTISEEDRANPLGLLREVESNGVTRLFLPYRALDSFCRAARDRPNRLLEIATAWEALKLTPSIRAFFENHPNCVLWNQYWPTETHVVTACKVDTRGDSDFLPPIGKPLPNVRIDLLDESGNPVSAGEAGEIHVSWSALADWYVGRQDLTDEKFAMTNSGRRYRTGDLARVDSHGDLHYLGRNDRQVKIRWYRIELAEIESAVSVLDGVESCAVVAGQEDGQSVLVAFVVANDLTFDVTGASASLQKRLPDYMVPGRFEIVEFLPLSPTGKTDAQALLSLLESSESPTAVKRGFDIDDVEPNIMEIWESLLGSGFDDDANFFEAGWTSLFAAQLSVRMSQRFGKPVSELLVYEHSTFRKYCEAAKDALIAS